VTQAVASTPRQASLVFPDAPSPARAVWLVALRELTDQMTSLRFLIIVLLAAGLVPLVVGVGARDLKARRAEYDQLVAAKQRVMARSEANEIVDRGDLAVLRALRPPQSLSILVRGMDGAMPAYWDFSPAGVKTGPFASRPRRLADLLGQLDMEFLIRVVLGLLAILLAFDAIAGEKELGTLRAVLSQPIARASLLGGKLLGGAFTLVLPLTVAFALALLTAKLSGVDLLRADNLAKAGLLWGAASAYLICLYVAGLLVSSLTATQKTSLVLLLVAWVFAVLAMPPLATLAAQAISLAPPASSVENQKVALEEQLHRDYMEAMGERFWKITGWGPGYSNHEDFKKHKEEIKAALGPLVPEFVSKRRRILEELDRDAGRREEHQRAVAHSLLALSPAAAFTQAAADLAATGDAQYSAWLEAVRREQSLLNRALFDDPVYFEVVAPDKSVGMSFTRRDSPSLSQLPAFVPPRQDALAALARALPMMSLLVVYAGVFIVGGFIAFARYDVR